MPPSKLHYNGMNCIYVYRACVLFYLFWIRNIGRGHSMYISAPMYSFWAVEDTHFDVVDR